MRRHAPRGSLEHIYPFFDVVYVLWAFSHCVSSLVAPRGLLAPTDFPWCLRKIQGTSSGQQHRVSHQPVWWNQSTTRVCVCVCMFVCICVCVSVFSFSISISVSFHVICELVLFYLILPVLLIEPLTHVQLIIQLLNRNTTHNGYRPFLPSLLYHFPLRPVRAGVIQQHSRWVHAIAR